jgi:hypothetical protein
MFSKSHKEGYFIFLFEITRMVRPRVESKMKIMHSTTVFVDFKKLIKGVRAYLIMGVLQEPNVCCGTLL